MASQSQVNGDGLPIYNKFFMEDADTLNNASVAEATGSAATENAIVHTGLNAESRPSISTFTPQMEHRHFQIICGNSQLVHNGLFFELRHQTAAHAPSNAGLSAGISSNFVPVTPDQNSRAKKEKDMEYCMPNLWLCETAKSIVGLGKVPVRCDFDEQQNKQQLQLVEDQSFAPLLQENLVTEKCSDHLPDLGKTPQQMPRRRKYKPNVISNYQPKGTANPRTAEPNSSPGVTTPKRECIRESRAGKPEYTPLGGTPNKVEVYTQSPVSVEMLNSKRSYERRKEMNQPTTPLEEGVNGATDSQVTLASRRSCKRSLTFESESQVAQRSMFQSSSDVNANPNAEITYACGQSISTMNRQRTNGIIDKTVVGNSHDLTQLTSDALESYLSIGTQVSHPNVSTPLTPLEEGVNGATDFQVTLATRRSCKRSLTFESESQVAQRSMIQSSSDVNANPNAEITYACGQSISAMNRQRTNGIIDKTVVGNSHDLTQLTSNALESYLSIGTQVSHPNVSTRGKCQTDSSEVIHGKEVINSEQFPKRISSSNSGSRVCLTQERQARGSRMLLSTTEKPMFCSINGAGSHSNTSQLYLDVHRPNEFGKEGTLSMFVPAIYDEKRTKKVHNHAESNTLRAVASGNAFGSNTISQVPDTRSDSSSNPTQVAAIVGAQHEGQNFECLPAMGNTKQSTKKRSNGPTWVRDTASLQISRQLPNSVGFARQGKISRGPHTCMDTLGADTSATLTAKKQSEKNVIGISPTMMSKTVSTVDAKVQKFNHLHIDGESNKKKCPRPKVDLDGETKRVSKLLLENINDEGIDGTDEQGVDLLNEDRKLFHKRVDSFISTMHMLQGDRQFTCWKGSVVDSVVGAFLTHRVADHVSSSAFISLASRFPFKSSSTLASSPCEDGKTKGHGVLDPDVSLEWHEKFSDEWMSYQDSMTHQDMKCKEVEFNNTNFSGSTSKAINSTSNSEEVQKVSPAVKHSTSNAKRQRNEKKKSIVVDWDSLRKEAQANGKRRERIADAIDSVDWEAVRCADVAEIAHTIKARGFSNKLAKEIKDFLNRLVRDHGSIDLEWLRDVPPHKAREYLLSITGLGPKSVECVRLLTLHHPAFPVDVNVGRIVVRLGWIPLEPLQGSLPDELHQLEQYPVLDSIQKYLWTRLCKLDHQTLYELHCQMITFGKVFCTKKRPNCNACPLRNECKHFASARRALPAPKEKSIIGTTENKPEVPETEEPIIEVPSSPKPEQMPVPDIEDLFLQAADDVPEIYLNNEQFNQNGQENSMQWNVDLQKGELSKDLVVSVPEAAPIQMPKLKNISQLRTEHLVYVVPDEHLLLNGLDKRQPEDPCPYLLAIWPPGETIVSVQQCGFKESDNHCSEARSGTVRGTILIPCRTAMRGRFPLNGTFFQVNEVFADHISSLIPVVVPRDWLWTLQRRKVYCGKSIHKICEGMSEKEIMDCFWRGSVCLWGFEQKMRVTQPLTPRLYSPASKSTRKARVNKNDE